MVIQPQARYDLKARVPQKAEPDRVPTVLESIVGSIDRDGSLSINSHPVTRESLAAHLFEILSGRADRRLFVRGAPELVFGQVVPIIDIAKGAGAGDVGLI